MNSLGKRIGIAFLVLLMGITFIEYGREQRQQQLNQKKIEEKNVTDLTVWYTDEKMTPYLEQAAKKFQDSSGIQIHYQMVSTDDYVMNIYSASLSQENTPDVYLLRNDMLESAFMTGLTVPVDTSGKVCKKGNYAQAALDAVTYNGKYLAYPLYYDIVCMLYNKDVFQNPPATMEEITNYAENSEVPAQVEKILNWNINDYFCNYSFIGNSLEFAGTVGDSPEKYTVDNNLALSSLNSFYRLSQYFAIDKAAVTQDSAVQGFLEGKTACLLADTEMVQKVQAGKEAGASAVNFGIAKVPDMTAELKSCSPIYTQAVVVNGMSKKQSAAEKFAKCLAFDHAEDLYGMSGYFAAREGITYSNDELNKLYEIFEKGKQLPKLLETEDMWMKLEVLFYNVASGSDINQEFQTFLNQMNERLD